MKTFSNLKRLWEYARKEKKNIIIYAIFLIIIMITNLILPFFSAQITVKLTSNELEQMLYMCIVTVIIVLISSILRYFSNHYSQILYRSFLVSIMSDMGNETLKLSNKTLVENGSGVFNERINSDTSELSNIIPSLFHYIIDILTRIGIVVSLFVINKLICLYLVTLVIISYFIKNKAANIKTKNLEKRKKAQEKLNTFSSEICRGARDIKMLNAEESFMKEYEKKILDVNKLAINMMDVDKKYTLYGNLIIDCIGYLLLYVLLYYLIKSNQLTIPFAVVVLSYKSGVVSITSTINYLIDSLKRFNLSSDRIYEIIDGEKFEKEKFGNKNIDKLSGDIEFKKVNFSYEKEKVINNMSFKIKPNETVAFVGKSGEGKTTIFNLLCKFYDVDDNMIFFDNNDINSLTRETIRNNITIISQDPYIFNMSIKDNFLLVKSDATMKEIKEICKVACLSDFIESLPDKYNTILGEGGINLSGGQKQRIAIARALLQKTEIILFDEATSALDNETQSKIKEAINNMKGNFTIIIIAHRFSTITDCNKIFYIENGKIKDSGTHNELLEKNKSYSELYEAEFIQT